MNDISQVTANTQIPALVSLTELATTMDLDDSQALLTVLIISTEAAYVTLFTEQGADVTTHFLDRTETWAGGYVYCLGDSCPACKAQIDRKRFLLLPVADLTDGLVKVIRVPVEKGPGKLLTELLKVLTLPNRATIITKITRSKKYQYMVDAHREEQLNPDIAVAIKRFSDQLNAGVIDLRSVVTSIPATEMAQHERIAKRLELEGLRRE